MKRNLLTNGVEQHRGLIKITIMRSNSDINYWNHIKDYILYDAEGKILPLKLPVQLIMLNEVKKIYRYNLVFFAWATENDMFLSEYKKCL